MDFKAITSRDAGVNGQPWAHLQAHIVRRWRCGKDLASAAVPHRSF